MRLSTQTSHRPTRIELTMTGMIDVVFLLLIFFLVTSAFVPPEHQLPSGIQFESQADSQRPRDLEPAVIQISWSEGRPVYRLGGLVTSDRRELQSWLERFPNKTDGAVVRATDDVLADVVAKTIADCKSGGFSVVTYVPL